MKKILLLITILLACIPIAINATEVTDVNKNFKLIFANGNLQMKSDFTNFSKYNEISKIEGSPLIIGKRLDYSKLCDEEGVKDAMRIAGYVIHICRWVAPLIIIVLGMIDYGKATIASDEKAISNATSSLIRRLIAGAVIFFIPTIILAILRIVDVTNGIEDINDTTFGQCTKCLFYPESQCPKN